MRKMLLRVAIEERVYRDAKKTAKKEGLFFNVWVGEVIKRYLKGRGNGKK